MGKMRVDIVTPSFNQGAFIQRTIDSVLSQKGTFSLQYLVMDGASRDATKKILQSYGKRLQWKSKKDNGQVDAINSGLAHLTKGVDDPGIVGYINSDDMLLPGALQQVVEAFRKHPEAMWLVGDADIVDIEDRPIQSLIRRYKRFFRNHYSKHILAVLNPIPQPAVFFRLEAFRLLGGFDPCLHYAMDYDYWFRLQRAFGDPLLLDQRIAAFRVHTTSKGGVAYTKQFAEEMDVAKKYVQNPLLLLAHALHIRMITTIYFFMRH